MPTADTRDSCTTGARWLSDKRSPIWDIWIYSHRYRFALCCTPRCGSTAAYEWFRAAHPPDPDTHVGNVGHLSPSERSRVLCDYTTMVLARDPWTRLVSVYYGKFVEHQRLVSAQLVIRHVQRRKGEPVDLVRGISFREFIDHLHLFLDDHWRPVSDWTPIHPTILAVQRSLKSSFSLLSRLTGAPEVPIIRRNHSIYGPSVDGAMDMTAAEIRKLGYCPAWPSFYDQRLWSRVAERYHPDITRFGLVPPIEQGDCNAKNVVRDGR